MSLNYGFFETLRLFLQAMQYNIFRAIIASVIIFVAIIIKYNKEKIYKIIITLINVLIVILINYYYFKSIIKFNFNNPISNIYFYFFNTLIYLILYTTLLYKLKYKMIYVIIHGVVLINILFSLFMTYYLNNSEIIVIGNIYPMIVIGNITVIIYYVILTKNLIHAIIKPTFKGVK